ncbi:polysaccharide pyruvyl transferase family protein [Lichenicola sp.]|uniref:polysaccharide pyruvyl transferase family protein n=1 Tax=Lichenicola sp. TaxID=2804529 RepID=UPI003B00B76E
MTPEIRHWLQGESVQNFGDFLSEYLLHTLFYPQPRQGRTLRIIGSCIDDWLIGPPAPSPDGGGLDGIGTIFWGCGLRREDGLSPEQRTSAEILAVRGPLTRAALRLDPTVPIGDPALLLPALYRPARLRNGDGARLIVPHFHDSRSDDELLGLTGCSTVRRPNIPNDLTAIDEFIDKIVAADFVLCGAMHAAIVAASYGRPFAFWDSGNVDLPFKWHDFAASIGIPCVFQADLAAAWLHYEAEIAPVIRIPVLWPLLVAAPLPVRPDALVSVMQIDIARHGPGALDIPVSSRAAVRLHHRLTRLTAAITAQAQAHVEALARAADEIVLRERIATLQERAEREEQRRIAEADRLERLEVRHATAVQREARLQARYGILRIAQTETRGRIAMMQGELARLAVRETTLAAEAARLHQAVHDRDRALAVMRADAEARAAQLHAVLGSTTWRFASWLRAMARRVPWARRLLRRLLRLS